MGCYFLSVGAFASTLTKNQIIAAILTFAMLIVIFSAGLLQNLATDPQRREQLGYFNLWEHMEEFTKGIVDTRRIVYYVSATLFFLFLTTVSIVDEKGSAMKARAARAGASALGILLAVALLLGVNYLSSRHWKRGDWTRTQVFSLSEKTRQILAGLQKPVRVTVFMTSRAQLYTEVRELLSRYQAASPKIEIEYLDPERNRARAEALVKELGVRAETVVFRSGDRKKYVENDKLAEMDYAGMGTGGAPTVKAFKGEDAFTSAILSVTEDRPTRVAFSKGHGEASVDSAERGRGYADAKQLLERENLTVSTWDSLGKDTIPSDADVLIVAGPRTAFLEPEAGALQKHLAAGGRALLLLDPVLPGPGAPPPDLGLKAVFDAYGVKLGDDLVVDPANALPMVGAETVLANRYGAHPIVRSLSAEGLPVILPLTRSVTKAEKPPDGIAETMLVETSPEGWGETNLKQLDADIKKEPGDTQGPVSLAIARWRRGREEAGRQGPAPGRRGQLPIRHQRHADQRGQWDLLRQRGALAGREREADRHRAEDHRARLGVADGRPGPPDRSRHGPGHAEPGDSPGPLGLVQASRLAC